MDRNKLYSDIAKRTNGDIYIGVVGPVRTGKSTFIKRFMDVLILPGVENEPERTRMIDELPQSANGRAVMTTQPKFVPNEAAEVALSDGTKCRVRLIDCVGYMVDGASGAEENGTERMVRTPWFDEEIPFGEAAEIGTRKVMTEHSTIGIVMTSDGTITDIPRADYVAAERRVIAEMQATGKPFVVVLNSADADSDGAKVLAEAMRTDYGVPVLVLDVLHMPREKFEALLEDVLLEFPLRLLQVKLPKYLSALPEDHPLLRSLMEPIRSTMPRLGRMRDYGALTESLGGIDRFEAPYVDSVSLGDGTVSITLTPDESLFYEVLSERSGCAIGDDYELIATLSEFAAAKKEYDRLRDALIDAKNYGYGIVPPDADDMELEEPEIVRQGNRFGVRLKARASGLHLIRVDIESEVSPIVGTEQQSEALVKYLTDTFETDPQAIWQTNLFGKPLYDLVREGMEGKMDRMPQNVRERMQCTLQRVVNDGCTNLICIML